MVKAYFFVLLLISLAFLMINYVLIKSSSLASFLILFECGFDCISWESSKMSLHFFKIGIIFILFDLELMFLLFILKKSPDFNFIIIIHLFIFLTFFFEILNSILKWSL